ncbi:hypothetical protein TNCV_85951 [Trichonephila clavipes]|nr:hypothetical protein TNCV_85951 [Trichonephila clavipes]
MKATPELAPYSQNFDITPRKGFLVYRQPSTRKSSREVDGRGREVGVPDHPQGVHPQNWSGTEQNRTAQSVLKAKTNDRRKNLALRFLR